MNVERWMVETGFLLYCRHTTHNILTFVPYHFVFFIWTLNPSFSSSARSCCNKKHTLSFFSLQTNGKKIERLMFYIHILEVVNVNVCVCIQFLTRLHSEWPFPSLTTMNLFNLLTIYFFCSFRQYTRTFLRAYSNIALPYIFHSVNFKASLLPFLLPINFCQPNGQIASHWHCHRKGKKIVYIYMKSIFSTVAINRRKQCIVRIQLMYWKLICYKSRKTSNSPWHSNNNKMQQHTHSHVEVANW